MIVNCNLFYVIRFVHPLNHFCHQSGARQHQKKSDDHARPGAGRITGNGLTDRHETLHVFRGRGLPLPAESNGQNRYGICEHTAQQFENMYGREEAHEWPAALHLIEDQRDDYAR